MNRPHFREQPTPGGQPAEADPSFEVDPFDATVARLHRYSAATEVDPPDELRATVASRVAREPASTPTRRFFTALRAHETGATLRAFRQSLATALGSGTAKAAVRAQAAVLVAAVILLTSISGVAAVASAGAGLDVVSAVARDVLAPKHEKAKGPSTGSRARQTDRVSSGQNDPPAGKSDKARPSDAGGPADGVQRRKNDGGPKNEDGKKGGGGKKDHFCDDDKKGQSGKKDQGCEVDKKGSGGKKDHFCDDDKKGQSGKKDQGCEVDKKGSGGKKDHFCDDDKKGQSGKKDQGCEVDKKGSGGKKDQGGVDGHDRFRAGRGLGSGLAR